MRGPYTPLYLLLFAFLAATLLIVVQLEVITFIFGALGLSRGGAITLLLVSLAGSFINLPVYSIRHEITRRDIDSLWYWLTGAGRVPDFTRTVIAVNVGGCVVPVAFSLYVLAGFDLTAREVILATGIVTAVSFAVSRPVRGMGIAMPILVAPLTAAFAALYINEEQSAPLAYVAGVLGVLIGADLLRMYDVRNFNTPFASIGGAGTFDGIFVTGVLGTLLTQI